MAAVTKPAPLMAGAEFLEWAAKDRRRWQLVDGEPQLMAPASNRHAAIMMEIGGLLREHLRRRGEGCRVFGAPGVTPHVNGEMNVRVPDLGVSCAADDIEGGTLTEPLLLIEILSPSNRRETWLNVWSYTTIPSVREILVLHSEAVRAELLRRTSNGNWPVKPILVEEGTLTLDSIGYSGPLAAFYPVAAPAPN